MDIPETIRELDSVAKDIAPMKSSLKSAMVLIIMGGLLNVLALVLYYLHITNLPVFVVFRIILGICGVIVVGRTFKVVKGIEQKYKAP